MLPEKRVRTAENLPFEGFLSHKAVPLNEARLHLVLGAASTWETL
jgi:hypothetical protein